MRTFDSKTLKLFATALVLSKAIAVIPADAKIKEIAVSKIDLYTQPTEPVCGEPVEIVAEIHTTKPGKVEFTLHRREGRTQSASLTTHETADGYVERWSKEYVYRNSVKREYMVAVKGQKFSTSWVPVDVKCTVLGEQKGLSSLILN